MADKPRTLDRLNAVQLEPHPWESVQEMLKDIYTGCMSDWKKDRVPTSNPVSGQHTFYIEVGKQLLSLGSIDNSVEYFSELETKMRDLGRNVAFLASEFGDSGLISEESSWLGETGHLGTHVLIYRISPTLKNDGKAVWPFSDCTPEEKVYLHAAYQEAKLKFFTEGMKYGASFIKPKGD